MGRDEKFQLLVRESARLNARPWDEVRRNYAGQPTNDGDGGGSGDGGDGGDGGSGDGGDGGSGGGGDEPDPNTPEGRAEIAEAEAARAKRELAQAKREQRQAAAAQKKADDDAKAEQGQYKTLAEERQTRITELETELSDLKAEIAEGAQRQSIEAAAESHGFRRPKRVFAILKDELGDEFETTVADESLLNAALRRLARAEPEHVDQALRSGAPGGGQRRRGQQQPDPAEQHRETVLGLFGLTPSK